MTCFDWFSSIILLCFGKSDAALAFLKQFSETQSSGLLWLARLDGSVLLERFNTNIHPVYWIMAHNTEEIVAAELPLLHNAFRLSGYSCSQALLQWWQQCFLNSLDWIEICSYVGCCIVLGPDYQAYFSVAVLKHLQPTLLRCLEEQRFVQYLRTEPVVGFRPADYLMFMDNLKRKYRSRIMKELDAFSRKKK